MRDMGYEMKRNNWWEFGRVDNEENEEDSTETKTPEQILAEDDEDEDQDDDDSDDSDEDDEDNEDTDDEELTEEEKAEKEKEKKDKKEEKKNKKEASFSAIKKDFPDLFKKHPALKAAIFKSKEFDSRFHSVEAADKIITEHAQLEEMRDAVLTGDTEGFLTNLKDASDDALKNFAGTFLVELNKIDKDLFFDTVSPIIKNIFKSIETKGKENNNEEIVKAVKAINKVLFTSEEIENVELKGSKKNEVSETEKELLNDRFTSLSDTIYTKVTADLTELIEDGLDPSEALKDKPNLKKRIIKTIIAELDEQIAADPNVKSKMNSLWARERKNRFKGDNKDSIINAYLSRARVLLPSIRRKIRAEFLGAEKNRDSRVNDKVKGREKDLSFAGADRGKGKQPISVKDARSKGMTDLDILRS